MSSNILTAIKNISVFKNTNLNDYFKDYSSSQINTPRQQIEYYVRDAISGSLTLGKKEKSAEQYKKTFSYIGTKNKPPDLIIKGGDTIVIRTNSRSKGSLTFSNSPPKDRLNWNDPWVLRDRRTVGSGQWNSKDIFYVNGWIDRKQLKYLYFVQGRCYIPEGNVYTKKINGIKTNIEKYLASEGLQVNNTIGLGKVSNMDPLGITNLRINGIWKVKSPLKTFSDLYSYDRRQRFTLIALMLKNKFESFPRKDIESIKADKKIKLKDVKIKNPNNPVQKIEAKLITTSW